MRLRFLGKDPESKEGKSPTVWALDDNYVVQGWTVADADVLAEIGDIPEGEDVVVIPKRLVQFFKEAQ